MGINEIFIEGR